MGRDYKDIVRELWDKIPKKLEKVQKKRDKAEDRVYKLEEKLDMAYERAAEDPMALLDAMDIEEELEEAEELLEEWEECLEQVEEMMDSLEGDEFLDIVDNYFDGFFEVEMPS